MEVERAVAPQLAGINDLPHTDLSVACSSRFEQVVAHDGEDGGFHGLSTSPDLG